MTNFIIFLAFYFILFLSGRAIFIVISKIKNSNFEEGQTIFGVPLYFYYPIIFLFGLGNLTLVLNFFVPVTEIFIYMVFLLLLPLNLLKPINISFEKFFYINLLNLFVLSISSYTTGLSYDAGLYHLNFQNYIKLEKIIFGLGNFHSRLAFSSIFDYINSNFWFNNNFLFLHFVNLIFISFFFIFVTIHVLKLENDFFKISSIFLFIFIFLDNFGFAGGRNGSIEIEAITKFDSVFAVLFTLSNVIIFNTISNGFKYNNEKVFLLIFVLFSIQLRPIGFLLALPLLFLIYREKFNLKHFYFPAFLGIFWVIKNLVISSCLIYPVVFSCVDNLKWSNKSYVSKEVEILRNTSLSYNFDISLLDWFDVWSVRFEFNDTILKNFLLSFFIIFLINIFLVQKKHNLQIKLLSLFYIVLLNLAWLISVPDIRFGISIFSTSVALLAVGSHDTKFFTFQNNFIKIGLMTMVFITILLVPRLENYKKFINEPLKVISHEAKNISYIKKQSSYGYSPQSGEQCWKNIKCSPIYSPKVELNDFFSYKIYELKK